MHWNLQRRSRLVYATLVVLWLVVLGWQAFEHAIVRAANRERLINRGRDITSTVGVVLRSQRIFGLVLMKHRLEAALTDLIRPGELDSIVVLNADGDPVVGAGEPLETPIETIIGPGMVWDAQRVTILNLVDLGTSATETNARPAIVLSEDMLPNPFGSSTNRGGLRRRDGDRGDGDGPSFERPPRPPDELNPEEGSRERPRRGGRFSFRRPPWMSDEEFREVMQKQGLHSFLIGLSTADMRSANARDLWMRCVIVLLATMAAGVSVLAWRNLARSSDLQIRLVKAGEMNAHLKEMNLAAAGLAHETRNPLNLIRGLAQLISKQTEAPADVRERSRAIVDEADRVTAQLNEFINYSRPREVRRTNVNVTRLIGEVARALAIDAEEKKVAIDVPQEDAAIEADDPLLRQVIFNLVLNAVQAVGEGGRIEVRLCPADDGRLSLEVRDDGPGVPPGQRLEIFKPYVTSHQQGTGLGLAVVQQIVAAHGWEIECDASEPKGAVFRIRHIKPAAPVKRA
ncbi:MAG TPA: hypothetical protein DCY13_01925 [Verrucomicrobiales bacterium]|nr:hypothetical protein [Verrucomicrobiales bacterium]